MIVPVRDSIDWVGFVDWNVRDFHGYETARGATYNAYLIRDQKTALIDTVKAPYGPSLLEKASSLVDLNRVDYVICNHAEPDHAGEFGTVMKALPNATLVCDTKCRDALAKHHDMTGWKVHTVATGDTLSLGSRTLHFIETPMVHWPESMFTYVPEDKLLFSMDAFGQHYASTLKFDDEVDLGLVMYEAKAYYANIIMPYGKQVQRTLKAVADLEIDMIAPAHGIIWRSHPKEIIDLYDRWSRFEPRAKVLVMYDSMWGSTGEMAEAIVDGASLPGVEVELIHVRRSNLTKMASGVLDAAGVAFGSSTLNSNLMPEAAAVLTYLKGLRPQNKAGFAFGSYGWGRGGPEGVDEYLKSFRWDILREPLRAQYRPTAEVLQECRDAGKALAEKALTMAK